MATLPNWTNMLTLRPEVVASDGGVGELKMSLHKAVYQTLDVPYREVGYYADITQPTPNLIGFFSRVARRLANAGEPVALYHLDQGMGGGKSHALVGLYHMASNPESFFVTEIGKAVLTEAQAGGAKIGISRARVITLTADHFSPGKPTELFCPAINLFERFLWALFGGDRALYDATVSKGANKATLQEAMASVGRPLLILLDELMDYAMALSNADAVSAMPGEQAFLNALMDACDDVPGVAFVLVMIRSELDPEGYTPLADSFREYIARRINRNGTTVAVTETGDFTAIIRRRIFEQRKTKPPIAQLNKGFQKTIDTEPAWGDKYSNN
jgi:predicted AAA+ superfamily ATPase